MNKVCDILEIEKPVIQAPMLWLTSPELEAAVSNAGGLGVLGVGSRIRIKPDWIDRDTRKAGGKTLEAATGEKSFLDMTRERWSVRKFAEDQISEQHMARILEAGRNAPSACNYQPQRVLVLQSDQAIAKIRQLTHWAFNAPTVLLVCADLNESWKNIDGCDSADVDAAIALDHMMMEAWECGVGSTWVRGFADRDLRAAFDLPANWKVVAMMPMGYPAENARPSNWHFRRKDVEELCQFI